MLGAPNPLSFSKDEIIKWQECNAAIKAELEQETSEQKQWQSLTKKERGEFVQRICNTGTIFVTPIFSIINEVEWLIWERNK